MSYDISESVSQRGSGEETAENSRIHEVADELRRRCQLYEAQLRDGQSDVNHCYCLPARPHRARHDVTRRFDKLIYLPQNIIIMDKQNNKKEKVYNDPVLTVIKLSGNSILADSGPCDWNQIS